MEGKKKVYEELLNLKYHVQLCQSLTRGTVLAEARRVYPAVTLPQQLPSAASRCTALECTGVCLAKSCFWRQAGMFSRSSPFCRWSLLRGRTAVQGRGRAQGPPRANGSGRKGRRLSQHASGERRQHRRGEWPRTDGDRAARRRGQCRGRARPGRPPQPVPGAPRGRAGPASCACHSRGGRGSAGRRRRRILRERPRWAFAAARPCSAWPRPEAPGEPGGGAPGRSAEGGAAGAGPARPAGGGHVYRRGGAAVGGRRWGRRGRGGGVALWRYGPFPTPVPSPPPQRAGPAPPRRGGRAEVRRPRREPPRRAAEQGPPVPPSPWLLSPLCPPGQPPGGDGSRPLPFPRLRCRCRGPSARAAQAEACWASAARAPRGVPAPQAPLGPPSSPWCSPTRLPGVEILKEA